MENITLKTQEGVPVVELFGSFKDPTTEILLNSAMKSHVVENVSSGGVVLDTTAHEGITDISEKALDTLLVTFSAAYVLGIIREVAIVPSAAVKELLMQRDIDGFFTMYESVDAAVQAIKSQHQKRD